MGSDRHGERFLSVQYLRAIAALMVVLHHVRNPVPWLFNPLQGYESLAYGVDIFFVISGFIMYVAAREEPPAEFLRRRIIRIVPLYWAATIALFLLNNKWGVFHAEWDQLLHVLKSLAFVPQYGLINPEKIYPYLIPGWTLNYEMFFYFVFFVALITGRVFYAVNIMILTLVATGFVIEPGGPLITTYTNVLLLEFAAGVWIAATYLNGSLRRRFGVFLLFGFTGLLLLPFVKAPEFWLWGRIVFASLTVVGAVVMEHRVAFFPLLKLLGDASYSIYLTHKLTLRFIRPVWKQAPLEGWIQFTGWVAFSLTVCAAVGVLVYWYFEKPSLKWLRSRWTSNRLVRNSTA